MPLTPDDIKNKEFRTTRRGHYEPDDVDSFLDEVEAEFARLTAENEDLRRRLDAALSAPPPQPVSEGDEMIRRTLLLAQRTADEAVSEARAEADRILGEARGQAAATLQQAQAQAAAAIGDLDRRRAELESRIEALRAFEREYRTRLRAYLETQLRDLDSRTAPADSPPGAAPARPAPGAAGPSAPPASGAPDQGAGPVFTPVSAPPGGDVPRLAP